jgi:hypothetical protein
MPILSFAVAVLFFLIINLFLALFLASFVVMVMKVMRYPVESAETSFLIFISCAAVWLGIRVIALNFYTIDSLATTFIWPVNFLMPKDIIAFLAESTGI